MIECVPNFSEGRNQTTISAIIEAISSVEDSLLLDVDQGPDANRTVVTFAGPEEAVLQSAFKAISKAAELIDMTVHKGAHPRIGATDVCPFVPLADSTMEDCINLANRLAKMVGEELQIPIYLYGKAARVEGRRNLANLRRGQYEGLEKRMGEKEFLVDYGPQEFNSKSGATAVGARPILVAYNVSLDTKDIKLADQIAKKIRESGRLVKKDGRVTREPGRQRNLRAIGWYMPEFGCCQVSCNILDYQTIPLAKVFELVCQEAESLNVSVIGSEAVGLIPLGALLPKYNKTGSYALESIESEVTRLGLNIHKPFDWQEKILEFKLANKSLNP